MKAYGNCSKNYINCRKHPERTTSAAARANEDFRTYRATVKKDHAEAVAKLAEAEANPDTKKAALTRLRKEVENQEAEVFATLPKATFERTIKAKSEEMAEYEKAQKMRFRALRNSMSNAHGRRGEILDEIQSNVDHEITLQKAPKLEGFRLAVTKLLVAEGTAYDPEKRMWGTSLGTAIYEANHHFTEDCAPAVVSNYNERFDWNTYDSFTSDDNVGVSADISCACGKYHKTKFVLEQDNFGSMFSRIMNMDSE